LIYGPVNTGHEKEEQKMDCAIIQEGNSARLVLKGEIDEKGAEEFKSRLQELLSGKIRDVVIDFDGISYIGSSGIGKILLFYKNLAVLGGQLQLINVKSDIYQLFRELKLDTIFAVRSK
jgi:anti-anti-sigma factor